MMRFLIVGTVMIGWICGASVVQAAPMSPVGLVVDQPRLSHGEAISLALTFGFAGVVPGSGFPIVLDSLSHGEIMDPITDIDPIRKKKKSGKKRRTKRKPKGPS